ncbi:MAG: hypothetical protein AMXMBFR64_21340 [Myxococcales bacterium]
MTAWRSGALALFLTATACEAPPVAEGGLCLSDGACPPSQMCREGQCAATCLSGSVCQTAAPLIGGISVIEVTTSGEEPTLTAQALFLAPTSDGIDESHTLAGSDCVLLPLTDAPETCGLSAGVITLEGAILAPSPGVADGAATEATLEPVTAEGGNEYEIVVDASARLAPSGTLVAVAAGAQVPAFTGQVAVPAPLLGALGAYRPDEGRLVATWEPGDSPQLVLRLSGPPSAEVEAARAALTTPTSQVKPDSQGEPRARTVVCPARDEAGTIVVPASVLAVFTPGPIEVTLVRSGLSFVALPEGDVMVRAAREVRMETQIVR